MSQATGNLKEVGTTKHYAEEHEVQKRQAVGVRRHKSLKPKTDTERQSVNATAMSVKEVRITRGDLALRMKVRREEWREKSAEAILRCLNHIEGPNEIRQ